MKTDDLIHRLRSYFRTRGMNPRQVAVAAGVNWRTAKQLFDGGNLTLDSLRAIEAAVPHDYVAPPLDDLRILAPTASDVLFNASGSCGQ